MARPIKQGLDYFPLDVGFLQDVKIRRIIRACGIQSIPILISLLSNIYRNDGYYLLWDSDMPFLIADEVGVSEGAVVETVEKAVQVDFFNANMYKKYSVLTSVGIQKRFFDAVTRRSIVRYDARFMLININVYNNSVNVYNNPVNVDNNPQSKVKKSKVKESKVKKLIREFESKPKPNPVQSVKCSTCNNSGWIATVDEEGYDKMMRCPECSKRRQDDKK